VAFIITGPALGYLVDAEGVKFTLMSMALIFAPMLFLVVVPLMSRITDERQSADEMGVVEIVAPVSSQV
jgi:hypothetical protein